MRATEFDLRFFKVYFLVKTTFLSLEKEKINSLEKLSDYSEKEIMQLHGFGKNTMVKLKNYMKENQVGFKEV